jgi:hypothetical protein
MNHNKVDQQLGGFRHIEVNLKIRVLFALHPSSHPNIHH